MTAGQPTDTTAGFPGLRLIEVTPKWVMGELERCLVCVWSGQPEIDVLRRRAAELVELSRKYPGRCALVEVVEPTSKPPTDETRRAGMEVFRQLGNDLSGIGFVIEGSELRATLTRSIITGMMFFVKKLQPMKLFKRVPDMTSWIRIRIGVENSSFEAELASAVEHLRKLMHAS